MVEGGSSKAVTVDVVMQSPDVVLLTCSCGLSVFVFVAGARFSSPAVCCPNTLLLHFI